MSALGQKRTLECVRAMSALPPKADIEARSRNVRFASARHSSARSRSFLDLAGAQIVTSAPNVASYLNLAQIYDGLAEQQEQLARDIVKFNIKTSA